MSTSVDQENFFKNLNTLGEWLFYKMSEFSDELAQIMTTSGEKDSYSDYFQRTVKTAISMRKIGVQRGDVVVVFDYNHFNTSVPWVAAQYIGAISSAMDPELTLGELTHVLRLLRPKLIFTSGAIMLMMMEALAEADVLTTKVVLFDRKSNFNSFVFEDFLKVDLKDVKEFRPVQIENSSDETAIVVLSNGSSDLPKPITWSHETILANKLVYLTKVPPRLMLLFGSLSWNVRVLYVVTSIILGWTVAVMPKFDALSVWLFIGVFNVDNIILSNNHAIKLHKTKERYSMLSRGKTEFMTITGDKINLNAVKYLVAEGFSIQHLWSQAESGSWSIFFKSGDMKNIKYCNCIFAIGKISENDNIKISDHMTGKPLGPNLLGEMRWKPDKYLSGYYGTYTCDAYDEQGFVKTGDLMHYDDDSCLFFADRLKELFTYRGYPVFPSSIEVIFLTHKDVNEAVVVGLPHLEDGMRAAAMVTVGCVKITEETLKEYLLTNGVRLPFLGGITIVKEIPQSTAGKIRRDIVRQILFQRFS